MGQIGIGTVLGLMASGAMFSWILFLCVKMAMELRRGVMKIRIERAVKEYLEKDREVRDAVLKIVIDEMKHPYSDLGEAVAEVMSERSKLKNFGKAAN